MAISTSAQPLTQKDRGAFFTPPAIADFLARWAIGKNPRARVLDPTCGEAVFLLAAAARLQELGVAARDVGAQLTGVDLHEASLEEAASLLADEGHSAQLIHSDFFHLATPAQIGDEVGWHDAVIGNPPFVRYQTFAGETRKRALAAALAQGVRLSGLASSWAATLVHATAFLKPSGRLAMVLPAELLTVHYAEPIRQWLRERFAVVNLVMFERLQFRDAEEQVVLLVAHGSGPCDSFCLIRVDDADDLDEVHPLDPVGANPAASGKWSDLLLPLETRQLIRGVSEQEMTPLSQYGQLELGSVTGANDFFAISEHTRRSYAIPERHLTRISPPGTRHLRGLTFTTEQWRGLRTQGERVWLLQPRDPVKASGLRRYIAEGEARGVDQAYKCSIRDPWWRPSAVATPDLLFTYMSHLYPRLIANSSGATILNSMHGLRLHDDAPSQARDALPLLMLNSATMASAEVLGRSYGGGILKMEPREAASLPVPGPAELLRAWQQLGPSADRFDDALRSGQWWAVVAEVDRVLLGEVMGISAERVAALRDAATVLRVRRTRQAEPNGE